MFLMEAESHKKQQQPFGSNDMIQYRAVFQAKMPDERGKQKTTLTPRCAAKKTAKKGRPSWRIVTKQVSSSRTKISSFTALPRML